MKRIPKAFHMGPYRIEVHIVSAEGMNQVCKRVGMDADSPYGLTVFGESRIYIQKVRKGFNKQSQLHTFWHEYFHMLFHHVGREHLSVDETLVDQCGGMHLQAMQSAEF
jgi:hypothetical protein